MSYRYCPNCKEHKEATKQVDLWSLPDVLVIHLKRFSASRYGTRDKISDMVDFPLEGLDLTPRVIERQVAKHLSTTSQGSETLGDYKVDPEPLIYDLFAVDNHFGGLGGVRL
jgi:ubiquitin carboxyl-terminal hydrolase 4/11/15